MTSTTTIINDHAWVIEWKRQGYKEMKWKSSHEPRRRSLQFFARLGRSTWHVTVTFEGSLHSDGVARVGRERRYQDLENLCLCLDFDHLQLLDDRVTELLMKRANDTTPPAYQNDSVFPDSNLPLGRTPCPESEYFPIYADLLVCLREDPYHVHFPILNPNYNIPMESVSEIRKTRELSAGVHQVCTTSSNTPFVFKEVERPLYMPRDSQVLYQELRNLQLCKDVRGIVQLVAAVVSENPYQTAQPSVSSTSAGAIGTKGPTVLRGILLEYHAKGTLENALQLFPQTTSPWRKWALQIAHALDYLHRRSITHMDIKPSNIIISEEYNALLTDISGIGGTTHEWLAPEMLHALDPLSENIESRIQNDIWAFGRLLCKMADASQNKVEKRQLGYIALDASATDPSLRPPLKHIISTLSEPLGSTY